MQFSELLQAVFSKYAINRDNTYIEMQKDNMVQMLKDTQIVVVPQKKAAAEPKANEGGKPKRGGKNAKNPAEAEKPAAEEQKEEPAVPEKIFSETDAMEAIMPVHSFSEDALDFFNFLDCIVRISRVYPFTAEQEAVLIEPERKLRFLCEKIDDKYHNVIEPFRVMREEIERQKLYQPRVVVDDEEDEMSDESGM